MSRIVISGASGDLGGRITRQILREVPASDLTLVTRTPGKLAALEAQGASVCYGDYNEPEALEAAYRGKDVLMLISGLNLTNRVPEHKNAIDAAKRAGIKHVVYTSVAGIHPQNPTLSAKDHIRTEADLRNSGLGYTVFRDATYTEAFSMFFLPTALRTGKWVQIEGDGRLAPVSKEDVAACAVRCLLDPAWHNGGIYEISGPELLSFRQIKDIASEVHQTPIEYVAMTEAERYAMFDAMGIPRQFSPELKAHPDFHMWPSEEMVTAEVAFQQGWHEILTGHVKLITGRTPISMREVFERDRELSRAA